MFGNIPKTPSKIIEQIGSDGTPCIRTPDEIAEYIKEMDDEFFFASHREVLVPFLPFSIAKNFLSEDTDIPEGDWDILKEHWEDTRPPLTVEFITESARDYYMFAWGKVMDHQGISASRSISKLLAWLWLLGKSEIVDDDKYAPYGAPILKDIGTAMGWPLPDGSEGTAGGGTIGPMMDGEACCDECTSCRT